jgi:hypothetical protein
MVKDWFGPVEMAPFSFEENLFICLVVFTVLMIILALCDLVGGGIVRILQWRKKRCRPVDLAGGD